jgi:hypothetical protein
MGIVQLEGDRVVLRPVQATEVDALEVMFTEPDVAQWWLLMDLLAEEVD